MRPETRRKLSGLVPLPGRLWLASPTMHGEELEYMREAHETNWMSTVGANVDAVEDELRALTGAPHAVALSSGTAALHLALRLAAVRAHGASPADARTLEGREVLCQSLTFAASANPVAYEGGAPVFVDSERGSWNMDPAALEKAFESHPDARVVVAVHLYGTPARWDELRAACDARGALLVEDAAEALGASLDGRPCGALGDYGVLSFNGNKIVTGSAGGALLLRDGAEADRARKWSTQSRDAAPWYQHSELGYNYRMSNVVAGVVRGQLPHLQEHVGRKREIWERYRERLAGLPLSMSPAGAGASEPNRWLSCATVHPEALCPQERTDHEATYAPEPGKSCPTELLEALDSLNMEGRPLWKPLHLQPVWSPSSLVTADGTPVASDLFARGLCLPSDVKMTEEQQDLVIACVRRCFS